MSVDLSTRYLGLQLKNPLVVSACPLTSELDKLRRLEECGAGAVVLPSLFEEQIEHEELAIHSLYESQTGGFAESLSYFPEMEDYNTGPHEYLDLIRAAKQSLNIPVIASLNGASPGGWIRYARDMQSAGADALELNIYFVPTDADMTSLEVEQQYVDLIAAVRREVTIPLAVKVGPFFSSIPHVMRQFVRAGANGLVLFNRFLEPDIELDQLHFTPRLVLSSRHELWRPLRWVAVLRDQLPVSLAVTSGVHFADDVLKALLVGADVTMMASLLLRYGPEALSKLLSEITHWMESGGYQSVEQLKGSMSLRNCADSSALERANYMKALVSYTDKV
ncbi:MAG: dihydroorotate dehydrogenase-like protein [Pirellulales bacterium]